MMMVDLRRAFVAGLVLHCFVGSGVATADDVVVELGAGDEFVIQDSSSTDRWRVDQSGNLTRSGSLFLHGGSGGGSVALGNAALDAHSSGTDNTAIGHSALGNLTSGSDNIAIGDAAGISLTSGSGNVYIANPGVSSELNRVRIGTSGLHLKTTIAGQVNIPYAPDVTLSGDGSLMLGPESSLNIAIDGNEIQARSNGVASFLHLNNEGGNVVLGRAAPAGRVQIPWVNANATVMTDGSSYLWGQTSTRRHKQNLEPFEDDYEKILKLRPYTFEYDSEKGNFPDGEFVGYMAEDVHAAGMQHLVRYDDDGRPANIWYGQMSVYMIELLREHESSLDEQGSRIDEQQRTLAVQEASNAELQERLDRMEAQLRGLGSGTER